MWSTYRTCNRLGVKSSIEGILIFFSTLWAHVKGRHRFLWPIIGNVLDDRKTRTTICTINKRISIAPIVRVKEFAEAIRTDTDIRGYGLESIGDWFRMEDFECGKTIRASLFTNDMVNACERGSLLFQRID